MCDGVEGGRQNDTIMVEVTSLNVRESFDAGMNIQKDKLRLM